MDATHQALDPVLTDLARSGGFEFLVAEDDRGTVWLLEPDGSGIGVRADASFDPEENAIDIAQSVQEYAIEIGGAWPGCPAHPDSHPLWLSDEGFYTCPKMGQAHAVLGQLAP